ncbi:MAG: hypothetical protein ACTSXG_00585 [Alphaproteobacteria bacterium]
MITVKKALGNDAKVKTKKGIALKGMRKEYLIVGGILLAGVAYFLFFKKGKSGAEITEVINDVPNSNTQ